LVNCCHYCRYHCITINNYLLYGNGYFIWMYCYRQCDCNGQPSANCEHRGYFDNL
jgi:hypothetical protein